MVGRQKVVPQPKVIVWERGRPRPQNAPQARSLFGSGFQAHFRAKRSFAGEAPTFPDNHLTV